MKVVCLKACFIEPDYVKIGTEMDLSLVPPDFIDYFGAGGATLRELEISQDLMLGSNGKSKKMLPQDKELVFLKEANKEKEAEISAREQEIAKLKAQLLQAGQTPVTETIAENDSLLKEAVSKPAAKTAEQPVAKEDSAPPKGASEMF